MFVYYREKFIVVVTILFIILSAKRACYYTVYFHNLVFSGFGGPSACEVLSCNLFTLYVAMTD
jgi:hypothetical protein